MYLIPGVAALSRSPSHDSPKDVAITCVRLQTGAMLMTKTPVLIIDRTEQATFDKQPLFVDLAHRNLAPRSDFRPCSEISACALGKFQSDVRSATE